jgi:DNA polymerase III subunit gamma/tau
MASDPSSHLVLARKWRPDRFAALVGQEHVTRTLAQALTSGRIAHAFLFTGIRGVGKTTAARILARCLNCEKGPTPDPCGECAACVEIREGRALDVVEIDGATYRKIDDARAIIENLSYRPARDRFKIYIIDEAHQLTDQAFNALLKTLEEPPAHVKFVLATTEPQKMPETILSRLQRYDFRRIPLNVTLERLKELAAREEVAIEDAALRLLAREAGGSMRDAERMLETAIAALGRKITESEIAASLGVAGRGAVFRLAESILGHDAPAALAAVREQHRRGANLESLGRDLLETLRNLAVAKLPASGDLDPLADMPDHEAAELRRLAERPSARDLMRLFKLMADAQEQILRSPYPDLLLEMIVVRMATLAPVMDADELLRALGTGGGAPPSIPSAGSSGSGPQPRSSARGSDPEPASPAGTRRLRVEGEVKAAAPLRASGTSVSGAPTETPGAATQRAASIFERPSPAPADKVAVSSMPQRTSPTQPARPAAAPGGGSDLPELREHIRARRAALAGFMEQGASLQLEGDVLRVIPRNDIYIRYLNDNRGSIGELANEFYGRKLRVEVSLSGGANGEEARDKPPPSASSATADMGPETNGAARILPQEAMSRPDGAGAQAQAEPATAAPLVSQMPDSPAAPNIVTDRQALYADPVVRRIFEEFQGRLVEVRARPDARAAAPSEAPAPVSAVSNNNSARPPGRRPAQE